MNCVTIFDSKVFADLEPGDVFRIAMGVDNGCHIKMRDLSTSPFNAVRLADGMQSLIVVATKVYKIEGSFVENYKG